MQQYGWILNHFTRLGVLSFYFAAFVCRSNNAIKESKAALKVEKKFYPKKNQQLTFTQLKNLRKI